MWFCHNCCVTRLQGNYSKLCLSKSSEACTSFFWATQARSHANCSTKSRVGALVPATQKCEWSLRNKSQVLLQYTHVCYHFEGNENLMHMQCRAPQNCCDSGKNAACTVCFVWSSFKLNGWLISDCCYHGPHLSPFFSSYIVFPIRCQLSHIDLTPIHSLTHITPPSISCTSADPHSH